MKTPKTSGSIANEAAVHRRPYQRPALTWPLSMSFILVGGMAAASAQPGSFAPVGRLDRDRPGPWDCDVMVYRVRSDGDAERLATFDRAGVPTLARLSDGRIIAALEHFPEDDNRNFDRVAVCVSHDEGRTWSKPQPIIVENMEAGLARPFDPTLVPLPDGRIRLYFTSNRSRDFRRSTPAIYSSISTNGVDYVFEPGVRFAMEGRIVIDCAAALHNGVFHLIVPDNGTADDFANRPLRRKRPRSGTGYHAVSRDGLVFERLADVKISGRDRWLGNMQNDGDRLVFFGTGERGVWSATSRDGEKWELSTSPVRAPGADPGALKLKDDSWLLAATGPPRPGTASAGNMRGESPRDLPTPGYERDRFESVFVRIPSSSGNNEGVAASILIPRQPRFANGAPVAIHVSGGVQAGSARGRPEYIGHGFVEIHFAFPGGGTGDERSDGTYDFRGPSCIRALADIIGFATGRVAANDGRHLNEVVRGMNVLTKNVGLVGSSHGGNTCGMAMALHGTEFPDLAWYASMESPYGEGAANVELGGRDSGLNPAYDPKTGALNLSLLAWSAELSPGLMRKPMLVNTRDLRGAFFFDLDDNGRFDAEKDFPVNAFVANAGNGVKAWYSPRIVAEAERRKLIGGPRPAHVPTLAESKEFWRYRDAAVGIPDATRNCTNLAVIVYANERDHVQADPAHTHVLEQVEGFRRAGAQFVRLNPDRAYVGHVLPKSPAFNRSAQFPDNPAGKSWSRANIAEGVEPSALPLGIYMLAAVCELADRAQAHNWSTNLDTVLFPGAPKPAAFRPGGRPTRR